MVLWTIVILSGIFTAALSRLAEPKPLSITIPAVLWLLMGISTTSLVGSPLIKSTKKAKKPKTKEKERTFTLLVKEGVDLKKVEPEGQILINTEPEQAQFSDMFKGEETGNAAHIDMAKVQMFFFTIVLVLAYSVTLGARFLDPTDSLKSFPGLDQGMVALLGISHAGYLTSKAAPR